MGVSSPISFEAVFQVTLFFQTFESAMGGVRPIHEMSLRYLCCFSDAKCVTYFKHFMKFSLFWEGPGRVCTC